MDCQLVATMKAKNITVNVMLMNKMSESVMIVDLYD